MNSKNCNLARWRLQVSVEQVGPDQVLKHYIKLKVRWELVTILRDYQDIFASSYDDILGTDPNVMAYDLK